MNKVYKQICKFLAVENFAVNDDKISLTTEQMDNLECSMQANKDMIAELLLRLRDMVTWSIANPDAKDRQFVDEERTRYGLSLITAYADLKIVKAILPNMGEASRDFHRWRYNEMILETYQMAKKRKDTKTMEKAATSYAKFNRIDIEDEQSVPYHMIVVQPFFPTTDPRVVGINPVPNIDERIRKLTRELSDTHPDTENIEYEEADMNLEEIFKEEKEDEGEG